MTGSHNKCQSILTQYKQAQKELSLRLNEAFRRKETSVKAKQTTRQIAELLALSSDPGRSYCVIIPSGSGKLEALKNDLDYVAEQIEVKHKWRIISGELTEQEISGDAPSSLNETMHLLLQNQPGLRLLVAADILSAAFPARTEFQEQSFELNVGTRLTQRELLEKLTAQGYVRYEKTVEPGGFRVRGEQVDIRPLGDEHTYTLTFFGSVVESIVTAREKRSATVQSLTVGPVNLPPLKEPLANLLEQFVVVSGEVAAPATRLTITTGAVVDTLQLAELPGLAPCLPTKDASPKPISYEKGLLLVSELTRGKPAVHTDHGIGLYEGLQLREINGATREYLVLRYAGGDSVSVPVEYAHKVTAYAGEGTPPLDRLGGTTWHKVKTKARADAARFAKELLNTASGRSQSDRPAYHIDAELEERLEETFPYDLTKGQLSAWQRVQEDLGATEPMDHLVVGDVGFGKTEIALRAARHAIDNNKQVALLAPTTLLVQQHTDTAHERLADIANGIATLSRFNTAAEAREVEGQIAKGTAKLVVGTHALLSEKINWQNLGLIIIDEEQRFGVKHKEHFKKIRAEVDVLSLSATPIPRTLSMALSGLKSLSVISSPPAGRQAIKTVVGPDTDERLQTALKTELSRQGQVYLVAPKIRQLPELVARVEQLVPEGRYAVAHGQLPSKELAHIMHQFDAGEIDILISSTIIENGIDLPNANTIIVTHATRFGLSDLYQLRGRVGRRRIQGHAYFLYNQSRLTTEQRHRLAALTEASRLGSGWQIAQRDLEIRGAGNLLGAEQSGSVNAIGVQLYLDLVQEAITKDESGLVARQDVDIKLSLPAHLPPDYIPDEAERSHHYQRLARSGSIEQLESQLQELTKRFGSLPKEVVNLELLLKLQHTAAKHGITVIESQEITPLDEDPYYRLLFVAKDVPRTVSLLSKLGNFEVRQTDITWDVDRIDQNLLQKLITALT